ncbi:hypothetical protein CsSME_00032250 [Camellia sinensis var. sinensis]
MKLPDLSTYVPLDGTNECKFWCNMDKKSFG